MTGVGVSLAIIGGVCFAGAIAWLTYEAVSAPIEDRWADFKDRPYADRVNTVPESYKAAVKMVITEEELISIHNGDKQ